MPAEFAEGAYRRLGIRAKVYSFFDRMDLAYSVTDFAIGRAGATFLAEIAAKSIPAILIPYPYAGGHQLANAEVYRNANRAMVVEQKELTADFLKELIMRHLAEMPKEADASGLRTKEEELNPRVRLADFIENFEKNKPSYK